MPTFLLFEMFIVEVSIMSKIEDRIRELGITLPDVPSPIANYVPGVQTGNLIYAAGLGAANRPDGTAPNGKVGVDLTVEEGYEAARLTGINILARLKGLVGDLDRIERIVKLLVMVNCPPDFGDHPAVANGCSDLMVEVFGDKGRHARSAVGMTSLPHQMPVEIEVIAEVRPGEEDEL
jgi:enamine deaminase RidA (YjgF/YER057c/UK114 family)